MQARLWAALAIGTVALAGCLMHADDYDLAEDDEREDDAGTTTTTGTGSGAGNGSGGEGGVCGGGAAGGGGADGGAGGAGGSDDSIDPGDLVITEIMNNPAAAADEDGEWFEIRNAAAHPIDLVGLVIHHQAGDPGAIHVIGESVVLAPNGFAVLARNGDPAVNGGVAVDYVYAPAVSLNNGADYLAIEDGAATVIDALSYDEDSGLDPDGQTRSLDALHMSALDNDDDSHFCAADATPGAMNDVCR